MNKFLLILLFPIFCFSQSQIGQDINGEFSTDYFGYCTALSSDGTILAVGAPNNDGNGSDSGHVRVLKNISGSWVQLGLNINGEATTDLSGRSVSLSSNGTILAIGAPYNDGNGADSGHVRVYQYVSGSWSQIGSDINGEAASDLSGINTCLSSDGSTLAIGAPFNDGNGVDSGHVRIYKNIAGVWTQIGNDIDGEFAGDQLGWSTILSSDGNIVAVGAPYNDGVNGNNSGHVRIFQNSSGTWTQIGNDIEGEAIGDNSGKSIAMSSDGSVVLIGSRVNDGNGVDSGQVRIYKNIVGVWTQIGNDIDGEFAGDQFGWRVALSSDGNVAAIGAIYNDGNGADSGSVRIYQNVSNVWTKQGIDIDGEAAGDFFGYGLSLSSDGLILASGAIYNDGNGSNSGHVRMYDLTAILGFTSFNSSINASIFPNPVKDKLIINLEDNQNLSSVNVYNIEGKLIKKYDTKNINISDLNDSVYFFEIITDKGKMIKKIIKN